MHYLCLIYFITQPPRVLGIPTAHHQEVFTVYVQQLVCVITHSNCCTCVITRAQISMTCHVSILASFYLSN
jgi:hypothetical protein